MGRPASYANMSVQQPKKEIDAKGAAIARTTSMSKKKVQCTKRKNAMDADS